MLERASKMFSCFLDVRKAFDTVWIDGLMCKLFSDLGVNGKLWLAIKDLYTDVKARVLYSGALSKEFEIAQGTGQGRILAPFMYTVYINSLLKELSDHCFAISINTLRMPAPSFADDICLIALHQSLFKTLMNKCHNYSKKWRYEFNHSKSGVVTFGETKPIHCKSMKEREWTLGDDTVEELYEYKNLGVLKNYCGSFTSNVSDNIDKTRKKAGMIFSSNVDRRKTNPLMYVKFWRQACLPSILFGAELFTITPSLLLELERCQSWFLMKLFYVPDLAPGALLLRLLELNSIEAEIDMRKLLFLGRLVTEPKMAPSLGNLLRSRTESLFDIDVQSIGILPSICEALNKYHLFNYFEIWFKSSTFPTYGNWKSIVENKVRDLESRLWLELCSGHPNMHVAQACLENVSPSKFWSLADLYPDMVSRLHTQVRLMGNLCLNGGIRWLFKTEGSLCFICKENTETVYDHFIECPPFRNNYNSLWSNLKIKIINFNQTDGITISDFMTNLDLHKKVLLLLGGLSLPFDDASVVLIKRFFASAAGKIHKLHTAKLRELEAP